MDPGFGQYWHFCGTIIAVNTNRNPYKGVLSTSSDKYAVLWIGFILKIILVE